ncbi:dicarboxylate/amino acid:cation symporter [Oleiharenicola lentus]|uniref:dicarboxylate/amino acid:cation symporter n=1 Tax=Oleiharenicola lentus TaxID=2508720 RepID=UPI003F66A0E7
MSPKPSVLSRISLVQWILIAVVAGIAVGFVAPGLAVYLKVISDVFLRLIRVIIAPVLFGVLVRAIGSGGSLKDLGRLGWKSLIYFEVASTLALLIGWGAGLLFEPGAGVHIPAATVTTPTNITIAGVIMNAVPVSIIDAMARGDVLQMIVFFILFGIACLAAGKSAEPVLAFADSVANVAFKFMNIAMKLAPAAVFAAMAGTVANGGLDALTGLIRLFVASWLAELLFLIVVLGGSLVLMRVPIKRFIRFMRAPFLVAFATTSSAAALPQTLEQIERFGVSRRVIGIVTPLSLSLNLNGSTLYIGLATLFVAQAAGVSLSIEQQLLILLTLKITTKGVAGIPRANFVVLAALFQSFGLPLEGLAVLLGVDALIDPIRTGVNVICHGTAPTVIARWEGETFPTHDADPPPVVERSTG